MFADADLDAALPVIVNAIVQNAGQTCSAGSRLLVERSRYEEVLERLGARFAALEGRPGARRSRLRPADPRRASSSACADSSPMRSATAIATVATGHDRGRRAGRRLLRRAAPDARRAAVVAASRCEEVFGPVLAAMPFDDEADAVRIANGTDFGLVAGVWTRDGGRQLRMARAIRSGQVFVNNYGAGGGVELPFGGVKHSGYGREKGFEALYGFTVLKTVVLQHG